ncbi:MAG: phosphate/phosphite/phosphonate ABC transporter substrate-binding protein [Sulfuricella sp.]|nr:phosphate/phosphite/phosphonate ABC transporter substrate-binding protein [Sulfuricella sp.]
MANRIKVWLAVVTLCVAGVSSAADAPLHFGVFPNLSARALVLLYQPMQAYLEKALGRPVQIYSAPDFRTFLERTYNREYDLVVMAPHLARLAQSEAGYLPLFSYTQELHAVVVVAKSSAIQGVEDLRGKTVVLPDRLAVMPMLGLRVLRNHGLQPDVDFKPLYVASHSNSALAVQRGDAQGAIIGSAPYAQFPEELRDSLRVVARSEAIPNQFLLASPNLTPQRIEALRKALSAFAVAEEGRRFLENSGFAGLKPASDAELHKMEPYARDVQNFLKNAK